MDTCWIVRRSTLAAGLFLACGCAPQINLQSSALAVAPSTQPSAGGHVAVKLNVPPGPLVHPGAGTRTVSPGSSIAPHLLKPNADLIGKVRGPEALTSGVIAVGGGNVVAVGGANVVAVGGANYRTLGLTSAWAGLAGIQVQLFDANNKPVPGVAPATTDATGAFAFHNVPSNFKGTVQASAKAAVLTGLVQSAGAPVDITPATTVTMAYLAQGVSSKQSIVSVVPTAQVQQLSQRVEADLIQQNATIDLSSQQTEIKTFSTAAQEDPAIAQQSQAIVAYGRVPNAYMTALDAQGNAWVVDPTNDQVIKREPSGNVLGIYPVGANPQAVAIDAAGNAWIANQNDNTVTELGNDGSVIGTYETDGAPQMIAFDAQGNAWIPDQATNDVTELTSTGSPIGNYPVGVSPQSLAIDGAGNAWVVDTSSRDVTELSPSGSQVGVYPVAGNPLWIALDAAGNAWISHFESQAVSKLSSSGTFVGTYHVGNYPYGLAADANGHIWVANTGDATISELDGQGHLVATHSTTQTPVNVLLASDQADATQELIQAVLTVSDSFPLQSLGSVTLPQPTPTDTPSAAPTDSSSKAAAAASGTVDAASPTPSPSSPAGS